MAEGTLIIAATPIGNLGDVSPRLAEALTGADVVYAEDTRRTMKLLSHLGANPSIKSLFSGNEAARTAELLEDLGAGRTVVLVSDAGTPSISDPGARAVREAREAGYRVGAIPGPSAVTTALAVAGFGADRFVFEGFLPKSGRARKARLDSIGVEERVVVVFATPHRLAADLADLSRACGPGREVVVARELSKLHEEIWHGSLASASGSWDREVKGEITLVLGPRPEEPGDFDDAVERAKSLLEAGESPSSAARTAAEATGLPRREIYRAIVELRDGAGSGKRSRSPSP